MLILASRSASCGYWCYKRCGGCSRGSTLFQVNRKNRAVALLTALFFGVLCLGLATAFLIQVPFDLTATSELRNSTQARYIADAAIQDTMAWISQKLTDREEPCTSSQPTPTRTGTIDDWNWRCTIEPDDKTPPNGLTELRLYKLTATATRAGYDEYQIVCDVQAGQSFARYAVYMEREHPTGTWYDFVITKSSRMRGPIHKNDPISFKVGGDLRGPNASGGTPPVDATITTSAPFHLWTISGQSHNAWTPTDDDYDNIFAGGEHDLVYGVPPRPLPTNSVGLANAAWGGMAPSALPKGVYVRDNAGIYISGDVTSLELSVDANGKQVVKIDQDGSVTMVVEEELDDEPGLSGRVIYATGDIKSLKGVNKGARTIANRFEDNKNIEITDSLTRADTVPGQEPTGTEDRLGLVSNTIYIADHQTRPRSLGQANILYLYAHMTAVNTFWVRDYNTVGNPGGMELYGGLATRFPWRTIRMNGSQVIGGYGSPTGLGSAPIIYDKLLAEEPPPSYPTTAATELMIRSWREQRF